MGGQIKEEKMSTLIDSLDLLVSLEEEDNMDNLLRLSEEEEVQEEE